MKAFSIKIDRLEAFRKLRKGPAGKGRLGGFSFKDKSKYNRKGRKERDEEG
jgi:hypothetical protein